MLLVLGSALDEQPAALVGRWRTVGRAAGLVRPVDLSQPGWTMRVGHPNQTSAVIDGTVVTADRIDAVICALPWIAPYELAQIVPEDREYVAQEMGAFLLAWLHTLRCPVLDRPTPLSLAGSGRSNFEWAALASTVDVAAAPAWDGPTTAVTVVGGRVVGDHDPDTAGAAVRVAAAAGSRLLTLYFAAQVDGVDLVGGSPRPDVGGVDVADALLTLIESG
jgi:hypothetical protein